MYLQLAANFVCLMFGSVQSFFAVGNEVEMVKKQNNEQKNPKNVSVCPPVSCII